MSVKFVDTNILIYAHDLDAGDRHHAARRIIEYLWNSGYGALSTQVLNEFYVNITQKIPAPLAPAEARALIEPYLSWHVETPGREAVLEASEIQERYTLSFWDALIVHAAIRSRADTLFTEDLNTNQLIEGVRIVNPLNDSSVHEP